MCTLSYVYIFLTVSTFITSYVLNSKDNTVGLICGMGINALLFVLFVGFRRAVSLVEYPDTYLPQNIETKHSRIFCINLVIAIIYFITLRLVHTVPIFVSVIFCLICGFGVIQLFYIIYAWCYFTKKINICSNCGQNRHCSGQLIYKSILCICEHAPHNANMCTGKKKKNEKLYKTVIHKVPYIVGYTDENYEIEEQTGTKKVKYMGDSSEIEKYETVHYSERCVVGTKDVEYEETEMIDEVDENYESDIDDSYEESYEEYENTLVGKKTVRSTKEEPYQDTEDYIEYQTVIKWEPTCTPRENTYSVPVTQSVYGCNGWNQETVWETKTDRWTEHGTKQVFNRESVTKQRNVTKFRTVEINFEEDDYQMRLVKKKRIVPLIKKVKKTRKVPIYGLVKKHRYENIYDMVDKTKLVPIYVQIELTRDESIFENVTRTKKVPINEWRNEPEQVYIRSTYVDVKCDCTEDDHKNICIDCNCPQCRFRKKNGYYQIT